MLRREWIARVLVIGLLVGAACGLASRSGAAAPLPSDSGWLGISIAEVTEELADRLITIFGPAAGNGVLVVDVLKGGPAEQAALRRGDVIIKLDAQPIWDVHQLQRAVRAEPVHKRVTLTVLRESSQMTLPATIGSMPAEARAQLAAERFGFLVRQADESDLRRDSALRGGKVFVAFVDPDSPAARAGLRPLDVILQANAAPIGSLGDFDRALRGAGGSIALRVGRRGVQEPIALAVVLSPQSR